MQNTDLSYLKDTMAEILIRITAIEAAVLPKERKKPDDHLFAIELIKTSSFDMIWTNFSLSQAMLKNGLEVTANRCSAILNRLVESDLMESPARNNFRVKQLDIQTVKEKAVS